MGTSKVFTVINSNGEGYNLLGIFDDLEWAQAAADDYNNRGKDVIREVFKQDPDEITRQLEFFDSWEKARVVEETMNIMRVGYE